MEALKKQCEALGHRTGAKVEFKLGELPANDTLAPGAHQAIFRVAQEALANIGRHARAGIVTVSLGAFSRRVDLLELRIEDDGAGFDVRRGSGGMGIGNMRARAAELKGWLDLTSTPGAGTTVAFSVPYAVKSQLWIGWKIFAVLAPIMVITIIQDCINEFSKGNYFHALFWVLAIPLGIVKYRKTRAARAKTT